MRRVLTFSVPVQEEIEGVESDNSVVTAIGCHRALCYTKLASKRSSFGLTITLVTGEGC